jgi:hypothetical protein
LYSTAFPIISLPKRGVDFDTYFNTISTHTSILFRHILWYYFDTYFDTISTLWCRKKLNWNCVFQQCTVKINVEKSAISGCPSKCQNPPYLLGIYLNNHFSILFDIHFGVLFNIHFGLLFDIFIDIIFTDGVRILWQFDRALTIIE